jgi:hypothetical protein
VAVLCYLPGGAPVTSADGLPADDTTWDVINPASTGIPSPANGAMMVVPDAYISAGAGLPITALSHVCPGIVSPPAPPAPPTPSPTDTPATDSPSAGPAAGTATQSDPKLPPLPVIDWNDPDIGEACVFARTSGASGYGHIGWGWLGGNGVWTFGATEGYPQNPANPDSPGAVYIASSSPNGNGGWHDQGSRATMLATFANPASNPKPPAWAKRYNQVRCEIVPVKNVQAADAAVAQVESSGYCLIKFPLTDTGNCLDAAITVLGAYGADMPSATLFKSIPNNWFYTLSLPPWGEVTEL